MRNIRNLGAIWLVGMMLMGASSPAGAVAVSCDLEYGNQTTALLLPPVDDPYATLNIEPGGGFRFSGQYLHSSGKLKTYVYQQSKDRFVLIHAGDYPVDAEACGHDATLTGLNRVYSPQLEREFLFRCQLDCRGERAP